jgi:hypothetical protein
MLAVIGRLLLPGFAKISSLVLLGASMAATAKPYRAA